ncbi:MAG: hypothetical protein ACP5J6_09290 [Candidatus Saccharicenans sp.]
MVISFVFSSCQKESEVVGLAATAQFSDKSLSDNLVTKLRVKLITTSAFKGLGKDYQMVAESVWQDKFIFKEKLNITPQTSKWLPNRVYETEKYVYIPPFIDRFNLQMSRGIEADFRIVLEPAGPGPYLVIFRRSISISPCPLDVPDIVFLEGWEKVNPTRAATGNSLFELWSQKQAVCLLKNPERPAILMIRGQNEVVEGQRVSIYLGSSQLDEFNLSPGPFEKIYSLTPGQLGSDPELKLVISVDKTIKINELYPGIENGRELGLKIDTLYFR